MGLATELKVVAVLAANPALSSILAAVLAGSNDLRVRQFSTLESLTTYMRLTAVDLVVADFDCDDAPADKVSLTLRGDAHVVSPGFQLLALARTITPETRDAAIGAGIDEVIVKPMSPRYLLQRVLSRLKLPRQPMVNNSGYRGPDRRNRLLPSAKSTVVNFVQRRDNVVSLFGDRPTPQV
jgi:DNA-binding response OmpR family regulator